MKKIAVVWGLMLSVSASAGNTKKLVCTSGQIYETFQATLDYSKFTPGSGYFNAVKASLIDNYLNVSELLCAGSTLEDLSCIGHAFLSGAEVVDVTLEKRASQYVATYKSLKGMELGQHDGPWTCTLK